MVGEAAFHLTTRMDNDLNRLRELAGLRRLDEGPLLKGARLGLVATLALTSPADIRGRPSVGTRPATPTVEEVSKDALLQQAIEDRHEIMKLAGRMDNGTSLRSDTETLTTLLRRYRAWDLPSALAHNRRITTELTTRMRDDDLRRSARPSWLTDPSGRPAERTSTPDSPNSNRG